MNESTNTRRDSRRWVFQMWDLQPVLIPLYALILSFVVGGVLIALIGVNPFEAYWALLRGMVGSPERIAGSIARSVPFIGSALALAFAFRAGLFNIGAEGQLLIGGLTAAWVGTWAFMADLPGILAIPIIILAGFVGGAFWGGIPGVLRARTGAHEVITHDHAQQHRPVRDPLADQLDRPADPARYRRQRPAYQADLGDSPTT